MLTFDRTGSSISSRLMCNESSKILFTMRNSSFNPFGIFIFLSVSEFVNILLNELLAFIKIINQDFLGYSQTYTGYYK